MSILETIGFKKKFHVGISISANNFIELVAVDNKTKMVIAYSSGNIKYNNAIREIIDYEELAEVVENLFNDAGLLPSDCSITLALPNVHFGVTTIESSAEKNFIIDNIQGEIEDLYVFKRSGNEPIISYAALNNFANTVVFSAIQTKTIRRIIEIFDGIGCEIVRIESSYTAFLKSLKFCDRFSKYMQKNEKTSILLITANNCCSFYVEDGILVDYFEEPIAVKSFSKEEVYATISKILETVIDKNKPQSILIVSETDEVDPTFLSGNITYPGEIDTIIKGINANERFMDISLESGLDMNMISYMTIEAVGSAVSDYDDYPVDINFLPGERINNKLIPVGEYEIEISSLIVAVAVVAVVSALVISAFFAMIYGIKQKELTDLSKRNHENIEIFKGQAASAKSGFKGLFPSLQHIVEVNKNVTTIFESLSVDIPENIYVNQFYSNSDGGILIAGKAKSSDAVKEFVSALKAKNSDLLLSKFAVDENIINLSANTNNYVFEIKTQSKPITAESFLTTSDKNKKSLKWQPPVL